MIKTECGGCAEALRLDLVNGEIRATSSSLVEGVYTEDPTSPHSLWMWDCPHCGYADSYYVAYGD